MAPADKQVTLSIEELRELIGTQQAAQGLSPEMLEEMLTRVTQSSATAMKRALKPENETHPGKSAFSYPEGDVARPKVALPFEFFYNGYPCHKFLETETWRECELMALITPGVYRVLRKDASLMSVDVTADRDANGKITRIEVRFPVLREEKGLVPPKTVLLWQILNQDNIRKAFLDGMNEFMNLTVWADPAVPV